MPISTSSSVNLTSVAILANTTVPETPTPNNDTNSTLGKVAIQFSTLNGPAVTVKTTGVDAYMISGVAGSGKLFYNQGGGLSANNLVEVTNTAAVDFASSTLASGLTLQFRSNGLWSFDAATGVSTKLSGSDARLYWVPAANATGATDAFQIRAIENRNNVFDTTDFFSTQEVMVRVDVPASNDAPDLARASSTASAYTENQMAAIDIAALGITLADPDVALGTMKLKFTAVDGVINYGGALSVLTGGTGTSSIELQGTLAQFQALLGGTGGALTYSNAKDAPASTDTITLLVDDNNTGSQGVGGALTDSLVVNVNITQINDAPVITATAPMTPRVLNLTANTQIRIQDIVISDADVGAGDVTVVLTTDTMAAALLDGREGSFSLFAANPTGVVVSTADGKLSLTGSLVNVNAALASGVVFTGDDGFDGSANIQITASDTGLPLPAANATSVSLTINGAPTITSVTHALGVPDSGGFNGTGWHGAGAVLTFSVNMSTGVVLNTTGGSPQLALTIGSTVVQAAYNATATANLAGVNNPVVLVFSYTIPPSSTQVLTDINGIVVNSLGLNGSTIVAATGGAAAILTLNAVESTATVNVDNTPPAAVGLTLSTDSGNSNTDRVTNDGAVTVGGVESGAVVQVYNNDTEEWETLTLTSGTFDNTDADGSYSFEVRQLDRAGNPSPSTTINFDFDTTAPIFGTGAVGDDSAMRLDNDSSNGVTGTDVDFVTNDNAPLISYETEEFVNFTAGDRMQYELDGSGTWVSLTALETSFRSFVVPGLTQGAHSIKLRQVDDAGNNSQAITVNFTFDSVAPSAPTGTLALTADSTNTALPAFATDKVTNNGSLSLAGITWDASPNLLKQYSIDAGANWTDIGSAATSIDPTTADGAYSVTLRQVDRAGNQSGANTAFTFTKDTIAPLAGVIDLVNASDSAGVSQTDDNTNDLTPTLQINFGADVRTGDVIKLYSSIDAGVNKVLINTFAARLVDGSGNVTFTPATDMLEGNYTFYASIQDKAGNTATVDASLAVILDRTAPTVPSLSLAVLSDTGSSNNDRITNDTSPDLRIGLSSDVKAGDLIFLRQGVTELYPAGLAVTAGDITAGFINVTVPTITVPAVPETGTQYTFQAAIEDIAGNRSAYSTATELTIDVTAPGNLSTMADLYSEDSNSSLYADMSLVQPASGALSTTTDNITNDNTPTFRVSLALVPVATALAAGDQIQLFRAGTTEISDRITLSATDITNGYIDLILTDNTFLADGVHTITAKAYDRAGNPSVSASPDLEITVDTAIAAPTALDLDAVSDSAISTDNVTNDNTLVLSVASTNGDNSLVQFFNDIDEDGVVDSGESLGVALVAAGTASITTTALADGTYNIRAVGVDRAGNVSAPTAALNVVIDTDGPSVQAHAVSSFDTETNTLTITASGMREDFLLKTSLLAADPSGITINIGAGNTFTLAIEDILSYDFLPDNDDIQNSSDRATTLKIVLNTDSPNVQDLFADVDFGLADGADRVFFAANAITDLAGNSMDSSFQSQLVATANSPAIPTNNVFSLDVYADSGAKWYNEILDEDTSTFVNNDPNNSGYVYDSLSGDQIIIDGVSAADVSISNDTRSTGFNGEDRYQVIEIEDFNGAIDSAVVDFSHQFSVSDSNFFVPPANLDADRLNGTVIKFADGSMYLSTETSATLQGGMRNDHLIGGDNGDTLLGLSGNDRLTGNAGNDLIIGGRGNDIIYGGEDNDLLTGGTGADQFLFDGGYFGEDGHDAITDFDITQDTLVFAGYTQAGAELLLADGIQSGADTILVTGGYYGTQTIRLLGITLADLNASDVVGLRNDF